MAVSTFVIVGAGLTGAKAAETLRAEGFAGRIVLVGGEPERPYERPPLSKGYLDGSAGLDSVFVHDSNWYAAHEVSMRLGSVVTGVDPAAHTVVLASGEVVAFDRLLLATGSRPRQLPVAGADLDGVHYLRTLRDADRLRAALRGGGRRVVVIGGGWIGLEVAAAARVTGNEVAVIEPHDVPLRMALGHDLGAVFERLHRDHGVDVRTRTRVTELVGAGRRVVGVRSHEQEVLPADVVVVGIGAVPNAEVAAGAGLEVDNGVRVDARLRSSVSDIWAAGDVANAFHPLLGRRLRVEHWDNAIHGGTTAARSMLGIDVVHDRLPYFFTDQYDLGMEFTGFVDPGVEHAVVYRGDREAGEFIAFWLRDGRVAAAMNVNVWDVADGIGSLIRSGSAVTPELLSDPSVDLSEIADVASPIG